MLAKVLGWLLLALLYGACLAICAGILGMRGPFEFAGADVPPAICCTVNLTLQFLAVHLLLTVARALDIAAGRAGRRPSRLLQILQLATSTVFFAPMLSVLFIAARVRAAHVHPEGPGHPQKWAQAAFYACTYGLLLQTCLTILLPLLGCGDVRRGSADMEADVEFRLASADSPSLRLVAVFLRFLPNALIFGGLTLVICSICVMKSPGARTPQMPPTLRCILLLSIAYFFVHLSLWAAIALRHILHGSRRARDSRLGIIVETLWGAVTTVRLCPMLAVLLLSLRVRAQQITYRTGNPQGWAIDAAYLCTAAVVFHLLTCFILGYAIGDAPELDIDGVAVDGKMSDGLAHGVRVSQALSFTLLFGGSVALCLAMWVLTPETAGSAGLFSAA